MNPFITVENLKPGHIARVVSVPGLPGVLVRVTASALAFSGTNYRYFHGVLPDGSPIAFPIQDVHSAREGLTLADYVKAEDLRFASTGDTVVHAFSRLVSRLQAECEFYSHATDWIHTHPLFVAYLSQLNHLSGFSDSGVAQALDNIGTVIRERTAFDPKAKGVTHA